MTKFKYKEFSFNFFVHVTLKRNICESVRTCLYIFEVWKKAVIFKDIKAECKSNLFKKKKKKLDWMGGVQQVFIYTKKNPRRILRIKIQT